MRILLFGILWILLSVLSFIFWNRKIWKTNSEFLFHFMGGLLFFGPFTFPILYWYLKSRER